jgi:site-specific DNA recombinase
LSWQWLIPHIINGGGGSYDKDTKKDLVQKSLENKMKTYIINVAGYVRVSTSIQVEEGESLNTQQENIKTFAKQQGYKLTEIYADRGISGGTVKDRHGLLRCLYDGQAGKFSVLIIHRLSRFGRNARELLDNYEQLNRTGIELRSISEGIDFSTKYGKAMLGLLAVMAELERDIIKETLLENRIARAKRGIPTTGKLPYGRIYNRETGEWELNEDSARIIRLAAEEYLKGGSLKEIVKMARMSYPNLITILAKRSGNEWTIRFKGEEPITYTIPRLLPDDIIKKVQDRLEFNGRNNRTDIQNEYALAGFLRCELCRRRLVGKTQLPYRSYIHNTWEKPKCKNFNSISLISIEKAVFETIFENIVDIPSFEKAIAESMPDEKMINDLVEKIKVGEKELNKIKRDIDKLVDLALTGTLTKETIHNKEQELLQKKIKTEENLQNDKDHLGSLPNIGEMKKEAEQIRRDLLQRFSGKERLHEMTFEDKRKLLHWLFDGTDLKGTPYGIYVNKSGKGKEQKIDYFLYGRITGLRTLKGDDINYLEVYENCNTNNVTKTKY